MNTEDERYLDARYPLSAETARILAAAQEVHRQLGPGFEEVIYQRALAKELPAHGLEYSHEVWIDVLYRGEKVGRKRVDFMIENGAESVLVEIKAKAGLEDVDFVQALSYLSLGMPGGLAHQLWGKAARDQAVGELRDTVQGPHGCSISVVLIMRRKDETSYGKYATKRVVLEVLDVLNGSMPG